MTKRKKSDIEWKALLSPETFCVMRQSGTEQPFDNRYWNHHDEGVYNCAACDSPLFVSADKFDSGTGWPSYIQALAESALETRADQSHGMVRIEVRCANCEGHLGHVFPDSRTASGLRYCINSAALNFVSNEMVFGVESVTETAVFAMGCFWQPDALFGKLQGVIRTEVGYTGGQKIRPSYQEVCSGNTGHAEAIKIVFNPEKISYLSLLADFWNHHDPTTLNRQGPDCGVQYRSAIFATNADQLAAALLSRARVAELKVWGDASIVTEVAHCSDWWPAEVFHQKYLLKQGVTACHLTMPPHRQVCVEDFV